MPAFFVGMFFYMNPSPSLKKALLHILEKFLMGKISVRDLQNAVIPLLQISVHKPGRKNYIEKYLLEISAQGEKLSRSEVYEIREKILGQFVNADEKRNPFKYTLRKTIERFLYDEIEAEYFIGLLSDLFVENENEWKNDMDLKNYFNVIQNTVPLEAKELDSERILDLTIEFYDRYYRSLWD